jgi:hypothetical protein
MPGDPPAPRSATAAAYCCGFTPNISTGGTYAASSSQSPPGRHRILGRGMTEVKLVFSILAPANVVWRSSSLSGGR